MAHVTLRPLTRDDFPLLSAWLRSPPVARWWAEDPDPDAIERRYGPSIDGIDPTRVRVALLDGAPVGLTQWYRLAAEPEYEKELAPILAVHAGDVSLDYLIGEASALGRGLGAAAITATVAEAWSADPSARRFIVPVHADNRRSWRALERAGFTRTAEGELEPDNPADDRRHVIYALLRPGNTPFR